MGSKVIIMGGDPEKNKEIIESLGGKGVDLVLLAKQGDDLADVLRANGWASLLSGGYTGDMPKPAGQVEQGQCVFAESICDPLQDAIYSAAFLCERAKDGNELTLKIMQKHLMNLHALQIETLKDKPEEIQVDQAVKVNAGSSVDIGEITRLGIRIPQGKS